MSSDETTRAMEKRAERMRYYMGIAEAVAVKSHDSETKVGAILIKNDNQSMIASGFNGFVRGAPDHILPTTRPHKYEFMQHAEANLIYNCAKNGIAMNNCTLYCTMSPCANCARALWQVGITSVVAKDTYKDLQALLRLPDLKVSAEIDPITGFTVISYG